MSKKITVSSPLVPPLAEFVPYLEKIWETKWLTNNGEFHQELERALSAYLRVPYLSLFSNGTLALVTALQALRISGEVITTPFSFVATAHSLWWNSIRPVFADIDPNTCNLDPEKVEAAITPKTTAIMPVHVYGNPCDHDRLQRLADTYNLRIIYDAAHAFGVQKDGHSVLEWGDLSILSFHATKTYSTIEGGAIICRDEKMKRHIDDLKNFGFRDEVTVVAPGINAKLNEVQAAYGLLSLKYVDRAIERRKCIAARYRETLRGRKGLRFLEEQFGVKYSYPYFPVFIQEKEFGLSRDGLYEKLKRKDVLCRRYFFPLISSFSTYRGLPSAGPENLPVANRLANAVLCLPIHPNLSDEEQAIVIEALLDVS